MAKKTIILTHDSDHPDAKGMPGETIETDAVIADRFVAGGGAVAGPVQPTTAKIEPKKKAGK